jgi:hypothetical protein
MTTDQLAEHASEETESASRGSVLFAGFLLAALVGFALATEGRLEDDEARHYLQALYGWSDWRVLLDAWGRPGFTLPASIAAALHGTYDSMRVFSALCTWAAALAVWRAAWLLAMPHAWLAPLLFCGMPTVLQIGSGAYTEPVFAAALAWGLVLLQDRRFIPAALCLGWLPITRLEGALLIPPVALLFLLQRRWLPLCLLAIPTALWVLTTALLSGDLLWVIHSVPYRVEQYGSEVRGDLGYFALEALAMMGPVVCALMLIGVFFLKRRSDGLPWVLAGVIYFVVQELAYYFAYGSAGYQRFLVGIAPCFALAAHVGLVFCAGLLNADRLAMRLAHYVFALLIALFSWKIMHAAPLFALGYGLMAVGVVYAVDWLVNSPRGRVCAISSIPGPLLVGGLLLVVVLAYPIPFTRPAPETSQDLLARRAARYVRENIAPDVPFSSTLFHVSELVGRNPFDPKQHFPSPMVGFLHDAPVGTMVFWDTYFGTRLFDTPLDYWDHESSYWELLWARDASPTNAEMRIYRRIATRKEED